MATVMNSLGGIRFQSPSCQEFTDYIARYAQMRMILGRETILDLLPGLRRRSLPFAKLCRPADPIVAKFALSVEGGKSSMDSDSREKILDEKFHQSILKAIPVKRAWKRKKSFQKKRDQLDAEIREKSNRIIKNTELKRKIDQEITDLKKQLQQVDKSVKEVEAYLYSDPLLVDFSSLTDFTLNSIKISSFANSVHQFLESNLPNGMEDLINAVEEGKRDDEILVRIQMSLEQKAADREKLKKQFLSSYASSLGEIENAITKSCDPSVDSLAQYFPLVEEAGKHLDAGKKGIFLQSHCACLRNKSIRENTVMAANLVGVAALTAISFGVVPAAWGAGHLLALAAAGGLAGINSLQVWNKYDAFSTGAGLSHIQLAERKKVREELTDLRISGTTLPLDLLAFGLSAKALRTAKLSKLEAAVMNPLDPTGQARFDEFASNFLKERDEVWGNVFLNLKRELNHRYFTDWDRAIAFFEVLGKTKIPMESLKTQKNIKVIAKHLDEGLDPEQIVVLLSQTRNLLGMMDPLSHLTGREAERIGSSISKNGEKKISDLPDNVRKAFSKLSDDTKKSDIQLINTAIFRLKNERLTKEEAAIAFTKTYNDYGWLPNKMKLKLLEYLENYEKVSNPKLNKLVAKELIRDIEHIQKRIQIDATYEHGEHFKWILKTIEEAGIRHEKVFDGVPYNLLQLADLKNAPKELFKMNMEIGRDLFELFKRARRKYIDLDSPEVIEEAATISWFHWQKSPLNNKESFDPLLFSSLVKSFSLALDAEFTKIFGGTVALDVGLKSGSAFATTKSEPAVAAAHLEEKAARSRSALETALGRPLASKEEDLLVDIVSKYSKDPSKDIPAIFEVFENSLGRKPSTLEDMHFIRALLENSGGVNGLGKTFWVRAKGLKRNWLEEARENNAALLARASSADLSPQEKVFLQNSFMKWYLKNGGHFRWIARRVEKNELTALDFWFLQWPSIFLNKTEMGRSLMSKLIGRPYKAEYNPNLFWQIPEGLLTAWGICLGFGQLNEVVSAVDQDTLAKCSDPPTAVAMLLDNAQSLYSGEFYIDTEAREKQEQEKLKIKFETDKKGGAIGAEAAKDWLENSPKEMKKINAQIYERFQYDFFLLAKYGRVPENWMKLALAGSFGEPDPKGALEEFFRSLQGLYGKQSELRKQLLDKSLADLKKSGVPNYGVEASKIRRELDEKMAVREFKEVQGLLVAQADSLGEKNRGILSLVFGSVDKARAAHGLARAGAKRGGSLSFDSLFLSHWLSNGKKPGTAQVAGLKGYSDTLPESLPDALRHPMVELLVRPPIPVEIQGKAQSIAEVVHFSHLSADSKRFSQAWESIYGSTSQAELEKIRSIYQLKKADFGLAAENHRGLIEESFQNYAEARVSENKDLETKTANDVNQVLKISPYLVLANEIDQLIKQDPVQTTKRLERLKNIAGLERSPQCPKAELMAYRSDLSKVVKAAGLQFSMGDGSIKPLVDDIDLLEIVGKIKGFEAVRKQWQGCEISDHDLLDQVLGHLKAQGTWLKFSSGGKIRPGGEPTIESFEEVLEPSHPWRAGTSFDLGMACSLESPGINAEEKMVRDMIERFSSSVMKKMEQEKVFREDASGLSQREECKFLLRKDFWFGGFTFFLEDEGEQKQAEMHGFRQARKRLMNLKKNGSCLLESENNDQTIPKNFHCGGN